MQSRNYIIDFYRCILMICVIIGHTYYSIFRIPGERLVICHNLAVDCFFMISGLFMAKQIDSMISDGLSPYNQFVEFQVNRLKRLYPVYFLYLIFIEVYRISKGLSVIDEFISFWPSIFMMSGLNTWSAISVEWYVNALFWVGFVISGILFLNKELAVKYIFPILIWLNFSLIHAVYEGLNLNANNPLGGVITAGVFKAILGITVGMEIYYISKIEYLKELLKKAKILTIIGEIIAIVALIYCFSRKSPGQTDYIVYFGFPLILFLSFNNCNLCLRPLNKKIWQKIGIHTYTIYLTHQIVIYVYRELDFQNLIGEKNTYLLLVCISFAVGVILDKVIKIICSLFKSCSWKGVVVANIKNGKK